MTSEAPDPQAPSKVARSEKQPRKPRKMTAKRLHNIALAYLDRYEASEASLRGVLERRVLKAAREHGEDPSLFEQMIEDEVAQALRAGYVDNKRFAENQVYRQRSRGASARMIAARLNAKGIESDMISQALERDERSDEDAAWRYAQRRRLGPFRQRDRDDRRDRDIAALCRAGFGFSLATRVIDSEIDETDL